jgi:dolichol-phosphate mannosyltransferase
VAGVASSLYLTVLWFRGERPIGTRPLFMLGVLLIIIGVQFFCFGLLAEMLVRWQIRSDPIYRFRSILK